MILHDCSKLARLLCAFGAKHSSHQPCNQARTYLTVPILRFYARLELGAIVHCIPISMCRFYIPLEGAGVFWAVNPKVGVISDPDGASTGIQTLATTNKQFANDD